ncbi:MAG: AMP-binding protein, partial [Spirochaetia bacterium]|nr:AMP-binding protein [Spirochaetia bacterium]
MENRFIFTTLCEIPKRCAAEVPSRRSHKFRTKTGYMEKTWLDFYNDINLLSAGLRGHGAGRCVHAAFFADNRYEWALTDYALLACGTVSVPRGSDTSPKEQHSIFIHSDSSLLIMEDPVRLTELLKEFLPEELIKIEAVFLM